MSPEQVVSARRRKRQESWDSSDHLISTNINFNKILPKPYTRCFNYIHKYCLTCVSWMCSSKRSCWVQQSSFQCDYCQLLLFCLYITIYTARLKHIGHNVSLTSQIKADFSWFSPQDFHSCCFSINFINKIIFIRNNKESVLQIFSFNDVCPHEPWTCKCC